MTKEITIAEVKKHKTDKSVWIIINNDIYDVTSYLNEHPGGLEPLMEYAGSDGTQAFEDVGHSSDARSLMKKFKIGTLPSGERDKACASCSNTWKWALLALAGAIVIGFALKKYTAS